MCSTLSLIKMVRSKCLVVCLYIRTLFTLSLVCVFLFKKKTYLNINFPRLFDGRKMDKGGRPELAFST